MAVDLFDNWFDPLETEVRARSRQFIEELLRGELDAALARPRYGQNHTAGNENEGYPKFNQESHKRLWKELGAKDPSKGFGKVGDYKNTWIWFDSWVARVRAHCQEHHDRYR
jgi:hypothetical protein